MNPGRCRILLFLTLVAGCAYPVSAAEAIPVDPLETRFEALVELANDGMREHGVPGAAIGVLAEGRTFARGMGVTNVEHPLTVTEGTIFQIGSVTKTFTGTLLVRLAETGKLDLEAPVRKYLPEFRVVDPEASAGATAQDLLTHMGGWVGDEFIDLGDGDDALARSLDSIAQLGQLAPFRTLWSYSNSSFYVAGRLVEVLTGTSYETALQSRLLGPLGLEHCYIDPEDVMTRRYATGHAVTGEGPKVLRPWAVPRVVRPVGGLACDVSDMLSYARFHMGDGTAADGTSVISESSLRKMRLPIVAKQGIDGSMGLTWNLTDIDGVLQVSHGGATLGQIASLTMVPEHEFALVLMTNSSGGRALGRELKRHALHEYLGIDTAAHEILDVDEETLQSYAGLYSRPFAEVELKVENGRLMAYPRLKQGFPTKDSPIPPHDPGFSLALYGEDRFLHTSGPSKGRKAQILRNEDGSIGWLRMFNRIHPRVP